MMKLDKRKAVKKYEGKYKLIKRKKRIECHRGILANFVIVSRISIKSINTIEKIRDFSWFHYSLLFSPN